MRAFDEGRFVSGISMSSSVRHVAVSLCVAVWVVGMLAGCNTKEGSSKNSSQVAVKVNKEEISVHQVNSLLARSGNIPPEQVERARSAIVERLIDQELLVQQAKSEKLDRNPEVMQMLELARREILARAYADKIASGAVAPTDAEINKFYDDNPELFSRRRIYDLREFSIQVPPDRLEDVRKQLESSGGNLQQVMAWFAEQKMPVAESAGIKPAEQIPLEVLKNLSRLNARQASVIQTPVGIALIYILNVRDAPVDLATAKPAIERNLLNQSRSESINAEVKRLREASASTIEYVGEFKAPAAAAQPAPAPEQSQVVTPSAELEGSITPIIEKEADKLQ
jgi:EpsD family peptidyl-prolyl cis-trans isomerase